MQLKMNNPFKSKAFKAIQMEWYGRLKAEGFEDIEAMLDKGELTLYFWDSHYFTSKNRVTFEAQQTYFDKAAERLHTFHFESEGERNLWELHSEGLPIREIAKRQKITLYAAFKTLTLLKKKMML